MSVIIKTFETPGGKYVFDRETNSLLSVNGDEFEACRRIEAGGAGDADMLLLEKYTSRGYLSKSRLEKIEHPATGLLRFHLDGGVQQLTLQHVQQCNLRCRYCTYAGNYGNQRVHSDLTMPLETMKKAIDFVMGRSRFVPEVSIGHYSGEPLLNFGSIKACVSYINEKYGGRKVRHTLTTNGTLFDDVILAFLQYNGFNISISIDGPKELHDSNRVFADGSGSFDLIISNVRYMKKAYPELYGRVMFLTTVAPKADFACINDFYNAEDVLAENTVLQNTVNRYGSKQPVEYDDLYSTTYVFNQTKVLLSALGRYGKDKVSKLFATGLADAEKMHKSLSISKIPQFAHPSGPCIPGVMRPFVDIHGRIFPCERVSESDVMQIGHVDTGFDVENALAILNVGRLTEKECRNCWCFAHCTLCAAACDDGSDRLSGKERLKNCGYALGGTFETLRTVCLLLENGYSFQQKSPGSTGSPERRHGSDG